MSYTHQNTEWTPLHIKVFSKWVSSHLSKIRTNVKVNDVTKDLTNGVALIELAEILVNKLAPRNWELTPKLAEDMIKNSDLAIEMFINDGVDIVGISGKDINDNNEKLILDLIWILILHYSIYPSIQYDGDSNTLMEWAIDRTSSYSNVNDFQPYHLSMCALLDSYHPDKINYDSLDPNDKEHDSNLAISVMRELKIPVLLDTNDLQSPQIEEKALLSQLALAKVKLDNIKITRSALSSPTKSPRRAFNDDIEPKAFDDLDVQTRCIELEPENNEELNDLARSIDLEPENNEELNVQSRSVEIDEEANFSPYKVEGDNGQYAGKKFGMIMTLKEADYNHGHKMNSPQEDPPLFGEEIKLALALTKDDNYYLNPSGRMLDLVKPNIENDIYQQFTFGLNEWNTIIDSFAKNGMVWDVSDEVNLNPPPGTPFYVFPFHGRHNQHFVYKDSMIYAQQNGHVVTYIGGDEPLVMMPPSNKLKERQTFNIQLI